MGCYLHHRVPRARGQCTAMRGFVSVVFLLMVSTSASAAPQSEQYPRLAASADGTERPAFVDQIPQIIPGVQVGPVKLGMAAYDAAGVALAFERATGCQIDLLIVAGRVVAAGTRFGGCLHLSLSRVPPSVASTLELPPLHWDPVMDGPASDFVAAFGAPIEVGLNMNRLALIWSQGLVAHVGGIRNGDGNVTYLAVVMPGTTAVPAIGYLRISLSSGFQKF